MTNFTQRSFDEARTYELMAGYIDARDKDGWSSEARCIAAAFRAMYTASLSAERIMRLAEALTCCALDGDAMRAELDRMVKAKVLRRRTQRGTRLYEVNY